MRRTIRNKSKRNKSKRRNGGAATVMPLSYYNPGASEPSANSGHDLLKAIPPFGVRPKIGGGRRTKHKYTKRNRKIKGGFLPSMMEGFVASASKYLVPVALFAGYKLMTRKQKNGRRRTTKK
jgi:hypothetical protein